MTNEKNEIGGKEKSGKRFPRLWGTFLCAVSVLLLAGGCAQVQSGLNSAFKSMDEAMKGFDSGARRKARAEAVQEAGPGGTTVGEAAPAEKPLQESAAADSARESAPFVPASLATAPQEQLPFGSCKSMEPSPETVAAAEEWWRAEWALPVSPQMAANADRLYAKGEAVFATNMLLAAKCFKAAAKGGCVKAQERMGILHYPVDGMGRSQVEGIPANIALFRKWMELAADHGSVFACEVLGAHWYAFGDGSRSREWWTKAQSRGSTLADRALAALDGKAPETASPEVVAKNADVESAPDAGAVPDSSESPDAGGETTKIPETKGMAETPEMDASAEVPETLETAGTPETVSVMEKVSSLIESAATEAGKKSVEFFEDVSDSETDSSGSDTAPDGNTRFGSRKSMEPSEEMVVEAEAWWKAEWATPPSRMEIALADKNYAKGAKLLETDDPAAVKHIRRAAKGGCVEAQECMARLHWTVDDQGMQQVKGLPSNVVLFRKWMQVAAEKGSVTACETLGEHWYVFGDAGQSHEWWTKAKELGSDRAEQALAELGAELAAAASQSFEGQDVEESLSPEPEDAVDDSSESGTVAELSDPVVEIVPLETEPASSEMEIGLSAEESRFGFLKELEPSEAAVAEAEAWWKAEWTTPPSRMEIALAERNYAKGAEMLETDAPAAMKHIRRAAKGGCIEAQECMARLHWSANVAGTPQVKGLPSNVALFRKWMELAAENGSVTACETLGEHWCDFGDADQSREWWTKAMERGSERAEQALEELEYEK